MSEIVYPTAPRDWIEWFKLEIDRWPELRDAPHADGCPAGTGGIRFLWQCTCGATTMPNERKAA